MLHYASLWIHSIFALLCEQKLRNHRLSMLQHGLRPHLKSNQPNHIFEHIFLSIMPIELYKSSVQLEYVVSPFNTNMIDDYIIEEK